MSKRFGFYDSIRIIFVTVFIFLSLGMTLAGRDGYRVRAVDFLSGPGLKVNAAGPLLVKADPARNRIIMVHTNTSSVSIIDGKDHSVTNIPIKSRVPQYLKMEAFSIDKRTGNAYVIGNRNLNIVFPSDQKAITIDTGEQYEMVAVYEKNGNAFLVGRESKFVAMVLLKSKKIKRIPWVTFTEPMININQTPPPPLRKIICDSGWDRVVAMDGYTSTLYNFSATSGKLLKKRKLSVKEGFRWHMGGYNKKTRHLYVVIETRARAVVEAAKIDADGNNDTLIELPGLTEGVGVSYNERDDEVYVPYDNFPTVHVVDFKPLKPGEGKKKRVTEIKIPNFGNDASAIDLEKNRLYIASWGYGEVDVIDLKSRTLIKRIEDTGIIPHMFNMAFNPVTRKLYIPLGASAVNGSFGASLDVLDPETEKIETLHTGWAPVALVELEEDRGFMVFNSENQAAYVSPKGTVKYQTLPCRFINNAIKTQSGTIFVSYGPHQSYWPTVYIWAAKNGILSFHPGSDPRHYHDRRIPRMAQQMTLDKNGVIYGTQNGWGKEKEFLISLPDQVRTPNLGRMRVELEDTVQRETIQHALEYDREGHWLYMARLGERNVEQGVFQIYDIASGRIIFKYATGLTPVHLVFDETNVYVSNFDSNTISVINKTDFSVKTINTGEKPFKMALLNGTLYCIAHNGNTLQAFVEGKTTGDYWIPFQGRPDNLFSTGKHLIITGHTPEALHIFSFDPVKKSVTQVHKSAYPYGETTLDTTNTAFYVRGQFADGIFELNQIKQDQKGRLWITDYLAGKLFILE
ncbi:MAG: hypothetical protein GY940_44565 [bacterium]|nr:hypothetical protein [bacterium]